LVDIVVEEYFGPEKFFVRLHNFSKQLEDLEKAMT
jgi:hypothetical protein